jgi:hypothetical protein
LEAATSIVPIQQRKCLPLKRMTTSNNPHPLRVTIEMVVVMGSVSTIPSIPSTTAGW